MRQAIYQKVRQFDDENRIVCRVKDEQLSYHELILIHDAFHQFCIKNEIPKDTYMGCYFKHDLYHLPLAQAILSEACYVALNKIQVIETLDYVITDDIHAEFIPLLLQSKIGLIFYSAQSNRFEMIHQFKRKECMRNSDWVTCAQTSGTTANAKVIVYSSSNYAKKMINKSDLYDFNESTRLVNCVPFNRITTLGEFNRVSIKGGCLNLNNGFDINFLIKMLGDETITHFAGSVAQLNQINQEIHRFKPRKKTLVMIMGGSDFRRKDYLNLIETLNAQLINHYGSKEVGTIASDKGEGLVPVVDIKIIDHEIWVKTDAAMDQYLNQENTDDIWFNTKDTGYLDENGILHLTGRMSDWINLMGEKFSPILMEETIHNEFGIHDVLICDLDTKNQKVICVVLEKPSTLTLKEIRRALSQKFDAYTCPTKLYFIEHFIFTDEGKLDRRKIKEMIQTLKESVQEEKIEDSYTPIERKVIECIQRVIPNVPIHLDDRFIEIGGDSLKASELNSILLDEFKLSLEPQYFLSHYPLSRMVETIKKHHISEICIKLNSIESNQIPLYLIHDLSLDVMIYYNMANLMNRPVFGLRLSPELFKVDFSVESCAQIYLNEIKKWHDGPIYIGGLSIGGIIAYEMMYQEERVTYCCMMDTKKINQHKKRSRFDLLQLNGKNAWYKLKQLSFMDQIKMIKDRSIPFIRHLVHKEPIKENMRLKFSNAVKQYQMKPSLKRVDYFVALDEKDEISFNYYKSYIPNIVRYEAHCLHSSFVKGSQVKQSIEWINERLKEMEIV